MRLVQGVALAAWGLTFSPCAPGVEDIAAPPGETDPPMSLPAITVLTRPTPFDSGVDTSSITVLERDALLRSGARDLNGALRGLPGITLQMPGGRGKLSTFIGRGASAGLGQLSFDGVPLFGTVNGGFNLATSRRKRSKASRWCGGRAPRATGAGRWEASPV